MELKNLPPKHTLKSLLNFINARCWGAVDFVYIPQAENGSGNAGHAFLNFRSLAYVSQFALVVHHEAWDHWSMLMLLHSTKRLKNSVNVLLMDPRKHRRT